MIENSLFKYRMKSLKVGTLNSLDISEKVLHLMLLGMRFPSSFRDLVQNVTNTNERCLVFSKEQPLESRLGPALLPRVRLQGWSEWGQRALGLELSLWYQHGSAPGLGPPYQETDLMT